MRAPTSPLMLVFLLWATGLAAAGQFGKIATVFDLAAAVWAEATPVMLGLMVSCVGFVGIALGATAGLMVQGVGQRRVLVWALFSGAALSVVQAALPPLPVMLVLRLLEGVSHLAIVVAASSLIAQVGSPARQGLVMSLWSSFFGVSFAVTAWAGRPLAEAGGLPALILLHAAIMATLAALVIRAVPPDPPAHRVWLGWADLVRQHAAIYGSARQAAPAMGFLCYAMIYVAFLTLLPPMMGDRQAMVATALPLISIIVSLTFGVWALRHMSAVAVVQAGFALAFLGVVVMTAGWSVEALRLAGVFVTAAALGVVQGASFAAIPALNPTAEGRARAAGAIAQLGNLGVTAGTPVMAALVAGLGPWGIAAMGLPFCVAGIALHALQARRRAISD
jgi:MFS transporter, DHA1 family, inner membrane transport protein